VCILRAAAAPLLLLLLLLRLLRTRERRHCSHAAAPRPTTYHTAEGTALLVAIAAHG
jgi:hypothetical protein